MTRPTPIIVGIPAAFLLLFGAYMGSYYALLEPIRNYSIAPPMPTYHWNSGPVAQFFFPAHLLDRWIRPSYWRASPLSSLRR